MELSSTPWYRQFWPWFLITLPATVVVACIITVWIALENDISLVNDNYYQEGLNINNVIEQADTAARFNVSANLLFSEKNQKVTIFLSGDAATPKTLKLLLSAPSKAENDHDIVLNAQNTNLFSGPISKPLKGRYYLSLVPDNNEWRLSQEITFPIGGPITVTHDGQNSP